MTYRVTLLTTLLLMGLFSLFGCGKKPDLDESVLIQLKKAGSDLSKPHHIEFFGSSTFVMGKRLNAREKVGEMGG